MSKEGKPAQLLPFPKRPARTRKCAICGRPQMQPHEPFCSKRCADEDLRRWMTGEYRIPTREPPDPEGPEEGS